MYVLTALIVSSVSVLVSGLGADSPPCRFAAAHSRKSILEQPNRFAWDLLYWEGRFHQNNVSYNNQNGMTFDGTLLDPHSGIATVKHPFSAASKEVYHPISMEELDLFVFRRYRLCFSLMPLPVISEPQGSSLH